MTLLVRPAIAPVVFFVRRYALSEAAGTALLLLTGLPVLHSTGSPLATAVVASTAEGVGFYAVAILVTLREQRRIGVRRRLLLRSVALCVAEFGPAELLDTLVRPLLLLAATVVVPVPALALLLGKTASDVVFYVFAANAYRVTRYLGWRTATAAAVVAPPFEEVALRMQRRRELRERFGQVGLEALAERYGTPLLVLDPGAAAAAYRGLADALPFVRWHYAVKALDHPDVLDAIRDAGGRFDVASVPELEAVLARGVTPDRVIYTNPVAPTAERARVAAGGVRTVVVDTEAELAKTAALPAGTDVLIRLAYRNPAAGVDLSSKFGVDPATAERLVVEALALGVRVAGFSFHVGSQLDAIEPWREAITRTLALMDALERRYAIRFRVLDIGGGFPASYRERTVPVPRIAAAIRPLLEPVAERLTILAEPGRAIAADAMIALSRVVCTADRPDGRWAYLDDGLYGSYSNVLSDGARPLLIAAAELDGAEADLPVVLAGPTCDSLDVIDRAWPMPPLAEGDLVVGTTMGAYTAVTSCRFNGRAPARVVTVRSVAATAVPSP